MSKLTVKTEGDRHIVVTRRCAASPEAVYRAHTEPALIQKWLLGPDGWTRRQDSIRVVERRRRRILSDRRISGTRAVQSDRSRGANAPAGSNAG
jgi:uncharacterized protein YndB with AHSA1/START domain